MANPLQPACKNVLENEYEACAFNISATGRTGTPDILACINGIFYGFEIKWKSDQPSAVQIAKINKIIDAGGRAYFIRSVAQLRKILDENIAPIYYEQETKFTL